MNKTKEILIDAGVKDTYWGRAILSAQKVGHFTPANKNKAGNWVTCACGKITHDIPRDHKGGEMPLDSLLSQLGMDFYDCVSTDKIVSSAKTLVLIEQRAIEVALKYNKGAN
jgi:hypothetical protein